METYEFSAQQEERLRLEPAGLGRRLFAVLFDLIILWVLEGLLSLALRAIGFGDIFRIWYGNRLFEFLVALAYFTYYDSEERGGSFGKQAVGIRVVDEFDQPLSIRHSAWRTVVKLITGLIPFLWIVPIFTKYRQGIHDLVAKTFVIKE